MNPSSPAFVLPDPVGSVLSRLPAYPGSFLLVTALNKVLAKQLPADVRQYLLGKKLRIHVTDARLTFDFTCTGTRFVASHRQDSTDLTISAKPQRHKAFRATLSGIPAQAGIHKITTETNRGRQRP